MPELVEALQHLMGRGGAMSGLCHGTPLVRPFASRFHPPGIFALPVRFFPMGSFTGFIRFFFYSVLPTKASVIVYICVSGIADHRGKTLLHCSGFQRECRGGRSMLREIVARQDWQTRITAVNRLPAIPLVQLAQ